MQRVVCTGFGEPLSVIEEPTPALLHARLRGDPAGDDRRGGVGGGARLRNRSVVGQVLRLFADRAVTGEVALIP